MEGREVSSRFHSHRTTLFVFGYLLLFLAAFIGVAPLLQIIVPLHALRLDPKAKTEILSQAMFWGALTASASNVAVGAISDRTRSRFGRRRPWILGGALLTALSFAAVSAASTPAALVWAVIGFQLAFNIFVAPLWAVFAERVPIQLRSRVSALLGMCYPLGVALGSSLMALGPQDEPGRLVVLATLLLVAAGFFLLVFDETAPENAVDHLREQGDKRRASLFEPFRSRNFVVVWTCRFLIATGYAFVSAYLLYFITDAVEWPGRPPERFHALLTGVGFVGVIIVTGAIALFGRRVSRRQSVALSGAVLLCGATFVLATAPSWIVAVVAFAAYGLGQGAYGSVEMGLMADALPSQDNRGRDMGLNNLAVALPQALAPLAAIVIQRSGADVRGLYIAAALCFASAAAVVALFRSDRLNAPQGLN